MTRRLRLGALGGLLLACAPPSAGGVVRTPSADARPSVSDARPSDVRAAGEAAAAAPEPDLEQEPEETDPRSETVSIKLLVTPAVDAVVFWGAKKLGTAGAKSLDLQRPRNSGPMDVVIRAAGHVPFHTRLFTDRDDRLSVHLARAGRAAPPPSP